jgi:NADH-quinone oxidoreductase subunit N
LNFPLAFAFIFTLFSFAGIPPFAGFYAKLFAIFGLIHNHHLFIAFIVIFFSALSAANYLRFIQIAFALPRFPIQILIPRSFSYLISSISLFLLFQPIL